MNARAALSMLLILGAGIAQNGCQRGEIPSHLYCTWENMEVDKCASAWLLKRHVDSLAVFKFVPVGQLISTGTAFDTPEAEVRRTGTVSTFEAIVSQRGLTDPGLIRLGAIVHSLEIRSWESRHEELSALDAYVDSVTRETIRTSGSPQVCLDRCYPVFDSLYRRFVTDSVEGHGTGHMEGSRTR